MEAPGNGLLKYLSISNLRLAEGTDQIVLTEGLGYSLLSDEVGR